jgi:hypothetical protein
MTTIEKIQRVATLRGNKYMSPEMIAEDSRLLDELERDGSVVDVGRFARSTFVCGFDFPEDCREEYERVYHEAWVKQMRGALT